MAYNKQKLGLLPAERYPADNEWINERLGYLNEEDRQKVCKAYSKAFLDAVNNEPLDRKKTNKGRFTANTKLRIFIEKRFRVFNK